MGLKQKIGLILTILILAGIGAFLYISRPLPSASSPADILRATIKASLVEGEVAYLADNGKSWAKYEIDETLNGSPKHVEGLTNDIQGQIILNKTNPSLSKIGVFKINARTIKTDSAKRDNTVGRIILKSADVANEFIIFETSKIEGLPTDFKEASEFNFKIIGQLSVAGVTKEVTFNCKAVILNGKLLVNAETILPYSDFGMEIPKLPFLAWVDDKVKLSLNFVGQTL